MRLPPGEADRVPTEREPDLSRDLRDLSALSLGGTAPGTLVRAGHVRAHHPEAAALADAPLPYRTRPALTALVLSRLPALGPARRAWEGVAAVRGAASRPGVPSDFRTAPWTFG
ncbi:hypothetical protein GA0115251_116236 [Streptomyces sp. TverLS-915]|nr:hypothetical protein GA0115251_116236 [Streptomyces sp. TverLS-915]